MTIGNLLACIFCRYNPRKYADVDDDSDMEANFDDILKEERRRLVYTAL